MALVYMMGRAAQALLVTPTEQWPIVIMGMEALYLAGKRAFTRRAVAHALADALEPHVRRAAVHMHTTPMQVTDVIGQWIHGVAFLLTVQTQKDPRCRGSF
jgi:hypothetical protein